MTRFLSSKKDHVAYALVLLVGLFMSGLAANAASTISTNISTGGTLSVTGAVTASSTLATSGNITVVAGYGLDTAGGGALNLGTTTATSITIGSSGVATLVRGALNASSTIAASGNVTVVAGYGLDTAGAGQLNLGTTTATSVVVGSASAKVGVGASTGTYLAIDKNGRVGVGSSTPSVALGVVGTTTASAGMIIGGSGNGISQLLFGACTPTIGALAGSSTVSVICTGSEAVTGTGYRVFVTPNINGAADEDKDIVFVSASSTASGIQVSVMNVNLSGAGTRNPTDNVWNWMAVR